MLLALTRPMCLKSVSSAQDGADQGGELATGEGGRGLGPQPDRFVRGLSPHSSFSNQWWAYGSSLNAGTSR